MRCGDAFILKRTNGRNGGNLQKTLDLPVRIGWVYEEADMLDKIRRGRQSARKNRVD